MTSDEMKTLLGLRMEDTGENNFKATTKYSALNVAQRTVANFLHESYLTELEFEDTILLDENISAFTGVVALTGNGIDAGVNSVYNESSAIPIRNSIRMVRTKVNNVYRYCLNVPFADAKKLENEYLGAEEENPVCWVFANSVHIKPSTTPQEIVLYYLKEPTDIEIYNNCILNTSLHDIVVDLAESELWRMDNNVTRSEGARKSAMDQIEMLNARLANEAPPGINA